MKATTPATVGSQLRAYFCLGALLIIVMMLAYIVQTAIG